MNRMKKALGVLIVFALLTLMLPYLALVADSLSSPGKQPASSQAGSADFPTVTPAPIADGEAPLLLLNSSTGEVLTVSMRDFLIGAVASELPISYQKEAFKAQAVAAHSYALASKAAQLQNPDPALKGAYLSVDPSARAGYLSDNVLRSLWGDKYDANFAYVSAAVDSVLHEVLLYDGQPALATYYAISNGSTQASEAVWSTALPYLVRLEMPLDKTSPDYEVKTERSTQEVADALGMHFLALDLSGKPEEWFGTPQRDAAGYIASIPCGGQSLKGTEVRAALGLRSADFDVAYADGQFTFTTRGYGHGVGMSQYAANTLAVTGKSYRDILAMFYPGTTLGSIG